MVSNNFSLPAFGSASVWRSMPVKTQGISGYTPSLNSSPTNDTVSLKFGSGRAREARRNYEQQEVPDPENPGQTIRRRDLARRNYEQQEVPDPENPGQTIRRGDLNRRRFFTQKASALTRQSSSEALRQLNDPRMRFSETDIPGSELGERLLGNEDTFSRFSVALGSNEAAKTFVKKLLTKVFKEDLDKAISSGNWAESATQDNTEAAKKLAQETIEYYRG